MLFIMQESASGVIRLHLPHATTPKMAHRTAFLFGLLLAGVLLSHPVQAHCMAAGESYSSLVRWKASGFATADEAERDRRATELADCLGDLNPFLRDGIAFEALSAWMRGKQLDADTLRSLEEHLLRQLDGDDAQGFRKPFAALALSEVARTDRVQPWMTTDERARMAAAAAAYLQSVRDYRGHVDGEGWRHGVAHGADWAMQLVLNQALTPSQALSLLDAVGTQIMPAGEHTYMFGEPGRLARPVAYAVARGDIAQPAVEAWLAGLGASLGPRPEQGAQTGWWIRRANLENFLHALAYLVDGGTSPTSIAFAAGIRKTMQKLP